MTQEMGAMGVAISHRGGPADRVAGKLAGWLPGFEGRMSLEDGPEDGNEPHIGSSASCRRILPPLRDEGCRFIIAPGTLSRMSSTTTRIPPYYCGTEAAFAI